MFYFHSQGGSTVGTVALLASTCVFGELDRLVSAIIAERLAETKLRTERSLNPKLINSPVDFACTR